MVDDLVIHLGDLKTGSTSIQEALIAKAWRAEGVRLVYPTKFNHIPLARTLYAPGEAKHRDARFRRLRKRIAEAEADVAVISAEHFEHVAPEALREALERHLPDLAGRARLIAYVRPHAERLVSSYAEMVKVGSFAGPIRVLHRKSLQKGRFRYAPRFRRWREVFGERFELRPMIRERLRDRDVVADFMGFVMGERPFELTERPASNESVTLDALAVLRAFHAAVPKGPKAKRFAAAAGKELAGLLAAGAPGRGARPALPPKLAEEVVAAYREDAAALDAEFFEGRPMSEALEAAPSRAAPGPWSLDLEARFGAEEARRIRAWAALVAGMAGAGPDALTERLADLRMARILGREEEGAARVGRKGAKGGGKGKGKAGGGKGRAGGAGPGARPRPKGRAGQSVETA